MSDSFCRTIANQLDCLAPLTSAVNRFLEQRALPQAAIFRVNLAIEEVITNTIKYAYDDNGAHTVTLNLTLSAGIIRLQFKDDGHPFNPLETPEPDIHLPLDQRKIGGLGLHLVRTTVSRIVYRRENDTNILEMDIARQ